MSDLIDRQLVLKAIDEYERLSAVSQTVRNMTSLREIAEQLPSAQPEIIRCKDCKYGDTFHEFDDPEMPMKCIGHHYGGTYPDDFCSYAERRNDG